MKCLLCFEETLFALSTKPVSLYTYLEYGQQQENMYVFRHNAKQILETRRNLKKFQLQLEQKIYTYPAVL